MLSAWRRWRARFRLGPRFMGGRVRAAGPPRWFTLHLYRWLRAEAILHVTPIGGALIVLCLFYAEFVLATGRQSPASIPPIGVLSLFVVGALLGLLFRPRLRVTRRMPSGVTAGETVSLTYTVDNPRWTPAWSVELDTLPLPRGLRSERRAERLPAMLPGRRVQVQGQVRAVERGHYVLPAPRCDSSFPFGLWRWGTFGQGDRRLSVYPAYTPLDELDMSFGLRYQPGGVAFSSDVGGSREFLSCREFRYGDDPRHLHWASWARLGQPVVKEFREEYLCRTALVLDTARPRGRRRMAGPEPVFEAAVSLTAAVAHHLARLEYVVELFAAGPELYRFPCGRSLAYLEDILEVLARLEPHPAEPMGELAALVEEERHTLSSALVVLTTWNEPRRRFVQALAEAGVATRLVLVGAGMRRPPGLPEEAVLVDAADVREGRCVTL